MITEFQGPWLDAEMLAFSETYPAVRATVPAAWAAITQYAAGVGATAEQLDAVRLGVTEAVTNVVRHAYRECDGEVRLTACVVANELWVLVADDGCGHHAQREQPGLGQGILLMAKCPTSWRWLRGLTRHGGADTLRDGRPRSRSRLAAWA